MKTEDTDNPDDELGDKIKREESEESEGENIKV